jgi:hypothetical protein
MQSWKTTIGLIFALLPIAYIGGLLYYFFNISGGSVENVAAIGLGPTVLGLGAIGLLLFVPLFLKLGKLFAGPRSPSGGKAVPEVEESSFDADAVFARYMAKRAAEGHAPPVPLDEQPAAAAPRPSFGRKVV